MERIEANRAIGSAVSVDDAGGLSRPSTAPSLLPGPTGSASDFASEIATLVIQRAHAQRKEARVSARQEEQQARIAEDQTVATMKAKARAARSYAHTAGIITIVGGAASCFGSVMGPSLADGAARSTKAIAAGLKSGGEMGMRLADYPKGLGDASALGRDASIEQTRAVARRALHDEDEAEKEVQEA